MLPTPFKDNLCNIIVCGTMFPVIFFFLPPRYITFGRCFKKSHPSIGRELATLHEKATSSGTEPYARYKLKARTGGGGENGRQTCDYGLSRSWKVEV